MEFVFVLAIFVLKVFFIDFVQVVYIVGTFWIHAFVNNKSLAFFLRNQRMVAMRTFQGIGF